MSFSSLQWGETHIVQTIGLRNLYRAPAFLKTHYAYGQGVVSSGDLTNEKLPCFVGHIRLPGLVYPHPCRCDRIRWGTRVADGAANGVEWALVSKAGRHGCDHGPFGRSQVR